MDILESVADQFETEIIGCLRTYEEMREIDLLTAPGNVFNHALSFVRKQIFPEGERKKVIQPKRNYYDIEAVTALYDAYSLACQAYNKVPSQTGFCNLTGIAPTTLIAWKNAGTETHYRDGSNNKLSNDYKQIAKKLDFDREESLKNRIIDGKGNIVGAIADLNHEYNWESGNNRTVVISRDLLPRRSINEQNDRLEADNMPLLPE